MTLPFFNHPMGFIKFSRSLFLLAIIIFTGSCRQETQWEGQEPITKVSTQSVPIQLQYKGAFNLGKGIFISNEFDGARLNGAVRSNDSLVTLLISPENSPINMSPWYAFKIWSENGSEVYLKLTYPETAGHRSPGNAQPDRDRILAAARLARPYRYAGQ